MSQVLNTKNWSLQDNGQVSFVENVNIRSEEQGKKENPYFSAGQVTFHA